MSVQVRIPTAVVAEVNSKDEKHAELLLRKKHLRVSRVKSRDNLVQTVASLLPELVLIDFTFEKDMQGLLATLRKASPGSPVVVVIDKSRPKSGSHVIDLDAADVLFKPFTTFEFGYRIGRCLSTARTATANAVRAASDRGELTLSPSALVIASAMASQPSMDTFSGLRDTESGRLDSKLVSDYLDIPLKQLAESIGENYKALHKTPAKEAIQSKLMPIERIVSRLEDRFHERGHVRAWLRTPHPDLGGRTALDILLEGNSAIVSDMLEAAASGLPS